MKPITIEKTVTHHFQQANFGPIVRVTINTLWANTEHIGHKLPHDEPPTSSSGESEHVIYIVKDYFDKQIEIHKSNPRWLLSVPDKFLPNAFHPDFLAKYKEGKWNEYGYKNRHIPVAEAVESGRFELLGFDRISQNNYLYDMNNVIIPCDFSFDYINGRLTNLKYRLKPLLAHLQKNERVKNAKIGEIPYYNRDSGSHYIEFSYSPTVEEFATHHKHPNSVVKTLGVEQFAKEEDEYE